jgi:hypothetical protein
VELLDADPDLVRAVARKVQKKKRFGLSPEEAWCLAALIESAVDRLEASRIADPEEDARDLDAIAAALKSREAA